MNGLGMIGTGWGSVPEWKNVFCVASGIATGTFAVLKLTLATQIAWYAHKCNSNTQGPAAYIFGAKVYLCRNLNSSHLEYGILAGVIALGFIAFGTRSCWLPRRPPIRRQPSDHDLQAVVNRMHRSQTPLLLMPPTPDEDPRKPGTISSVRRDPDPDKRTDLD